MVCYSIETIETSITDAIKTNSKKKWFKKQ